MFRASLCPSSGEQRTRYCIWCIVLFLLDVVGSGCGALSLKDVSTSAHILQGILVASCWFFSLHSFYMLRFLHTVYVHIHVYIIKLTQYFRRLDRKHAIFFICAAREPAHTLRRNEGWQAYFPLRKVGVMCVIALSSNITAKHNAIVSARGPSQVAFLCGNNWLLAFGNAVWA